MFPLTHTAIQEPKDQTHSTRTAEVYMPWWKGGQHSCGISNQVCPFWCLPSGWQKWIKSEDYGPQTFEWCWVYIQTQKSSRNCWLEKESSQLTGPPLWRSYVILNSPPLLVIPGVLNSEQWIACLEIHENMLILCILCVVSCVPFIHVPCSHFYQFSVHNHIQTLHIRFLSTLLCGLLLIVNYLIPVLQWSILLHYAWLQCSYFLFHAQYVL